MGFMDPREWLATLEKQAACGGSQRPSTGTARSEPALPQCTKLPLLGIAVRRVLLTPGSAAAERRRLDVGVMRIEGDSADQEAKL